MKKCEKPVCLVLIASFLLMVGCKRGIDGPVVTQSQVPEVTYDGQAQTTKTDSNGRLNIRSSIASGGESFDLTLQVAVKNSQGTVLSGVEVTYAQSNGNIVLQVRDPLKRVVPALFVGTPRELQSYFGGTPLQKSDQTNGRPVLAKTTVIPLLIGALIVLAALTYAELQVIKGAYQIQKFYLTDYVTEGDDYVMYCKTFSEIADLMKSRYSITVNLTSIFVSFVTLGVGGLPVTGAQAAIEFTEQAMNFGAEEIRDALVEKAMAVWGLSADQLVNRKIAVKVYPYDRNTAFANARNLFAVYSLDITDTRCAIEGDAISGTVSEAVSGNQLPNVVVKLTGNATRTTTTDATGNYSFPNLSAGTYTVSASLAGYIADSKTVTTNGTPVVVNFVLSKTLPSGQTRFVLQWGPEPSDLDGHLTGPLSTGGRFHMYWLYAPEYGQSNPWSSTVIIDRDDTRGNGFETITLNENISGIYRYSVHDYTNKNSTSSTALSNSEANVSVYRGANLVQRFNISTGKGGTLWTVFEMEGSTIRLLNAMSYESNSTGVQKGSLKKQAL